jgi:hypothetical protein
MMLSPTRDCCGDDISFCNNGITIILHLVAWTERSVNAFISHFNPGATRTSQFSTDAIGVNLLNSESSPICGNQNNGKCVYEQFALRWHKRPAGDAI